MKILKWGKGRRDKIKANDLYDYKSLETRENTVKFLKDHAKIARGGWEEYWKEKKRYYDGEHDTIAQLRTFCINSGLPWLPSQSEDGFVHVETQIDPDIPDFEFAGRDNKYDGKKAKEREYVCRYITEKNNVQWQNIKNERRLNIYGTACWFTTWDMSVKMGKYIGDIKVHSPKIMQMFFDLNVSDNIDDSEYVGFVYRLHKMRVARDYKEDLAKLKKDINSFATGYDKESTEFMKEEYDPSSYDADDDTLQMTLFFFRQPESGKKTINDVEITWEAGDIGLITLVNDEEIKYMPNIWMKTKCKMYPFSIYTRVPNDDFIYGKSEIEMIQTLIDASDREMSYAQLNDAFTANDIIIMEETALSEDADFPNTPGAIVKVRPNNIDKVKRLGGMSGYNKANYDAADRFRELMQSISGNFDTNQGKEPARVDTAAGLAMLNDRAKNRQNLKKFDRLEGFKRLYKLCDYMALEYYDDDRIIYLGSEVTKNEPVEFMYNSDNFKQTDVDGEEAYYPEVDVKINVGDGLQNSRAFTVQSIAELIKTNITPQNYKIVLAYLDMIDISGKQEIKEYIEEYMMKQEQMQMQQQSIQMGAQRPSALKAKDIISGLTPEEREMLESNPEMLAQVAQKQGYNLE